MTTKYHQHTLTLLENPKNLDIFTIVCKNVLKSFSHWTALILYFSTKQLWAVSGRRHLHFGHINCQAEDGKRLKILLGQSPTMPRSLLGSIYQLQLALIRFKWTECNLSKAGGMMEYLHIVSRNLAALWWGLNDNQRSKDILIHHSYILCYECSFI